MSAPAIRVENLGKMYRIGGRVGQGGLAHTSDAKSDLSSV